MTALSDYLHAHLPDGWTPRDLTVALAADMDKTTVYRYLNGKHTPSPPEAVLQAFARVLTVPIVELRRAAGVSAGENEPWEPPLEANRLNHAQRTALNQFLRATAAAMDEAAAGGSENASRRGAPDPSQAVIDPDLQVYIDEIRAAGQPDLANRMEARFAKGETGSDLPSASSGK